MTFPQAHQHPARPSRLVLAGIAAALLLYAVAIAWLVLHPRFIPSESWVRRADMPSLGLGLLFGLASVTAFARAARTTTPGSGIGVPQSASDIVVMILGIALTVWATRSVVLDVVPYAASRGADMAMTETWRITGRTGGNRGPGVWYFDRTGRYRFSIHAPRYKPARQVESRSLVDCPSDGSRVRLIGTGNAFGLHYGRMAITDSETREIILVDFDQATYQLPERCLS
ncbi:MAG: hypothetical protein AAGE03_17630 [Pseudomonadota bacterium]